MAKKMSPKSRPISEMLARYSQKNGLKTVKAETGGRGFYQGAMHEMEKVLEAKAIIFAIASYPHVIPAGDGLYIHVTFDTDSSNAFSNTMDMLKKMAGVKVERRVSTDHGTFYWLHR